MHLILLAEVLRSEAENIKQNPMTNQDLNRMAKEKPNDRLKDAIGRRYIGDQLMAHFNQLCYLIEEWIADQNLFVQIQEANRKRPEPTSQPVDVMTSGSSEYPFNIRMSGIISKWHKRAVEVVKEWTDYEFDFPPTIQDLKKSASDPSFIFEKTFVIDFETDLMEKRAFVKVLVELMTQLEKEMKRIRQRINSRSDGTTHQSSHRRRSDVMIGDSLMSDYNMIGKIAKQFGLV